MGADNAAAQNPPADNKVNGTQAQSRKWSLQPYVGVYHCPLFGNLTVSLTQKTKEREATLECRLNVLTGVMHPVQGEGVEPHTYGVELTGSLRFLSKPSRSAPAAQNFKVTFLVTPGGAEVTGVNAHSQWAMEKPVTFHKVR